MENGRIVGCWGRYRAYIEKIGCFVFSNFFSMGDRNEAAFMLKFVTIKIIYEKKKKTLKSD